MQQDTARSDRLLAKLGREHVELLVGQVKGTIKPRTCKLPSTSSILARTFAILYAAPTKTAFSRSITFALTTSSHHELVEVREVEVAELEVQGKDVGENLLCKGLHK